MKQSEAGRKFLKAREELRLVAYPDSGGVWTIGYGHTGGGVCAGVTCTEQEADCWLSNDVGRAERIINLLVKVPLTQNQFDALCSFVFNIGINAFRTSTLLKKLNENCMTCAAKEFGRWIFDNGVVVPGLKNRRTFERKLFEKP